MRLLHQIVGITFVFIFLLTGQYLDFYYPGMEGVGDGMRMLLRSRHIYILGAGLVNLGVGVYLSPREGRWRRALQVTGSCLLLVSPLLLTAAFFYEPRLAGLPRTFTLPGILCLFVGTLLHLFSGIRPRASL